MNLKFFFHIINNQKKLDIRPEGDDEYFTALIRCIELFNLRVQRRMIGRAMSASQPGGKLDIKLGNYAI